MKLLNYTLFLLCVILASCSSEEKKPVVTSDDRFELVPYPEKYAKDKPATDTNEIPKKDTSLVTSDIDSNERIKFWNDYVVPILKQEREKVISSIDFPLEGEWAYMIGLKKTGIEATRSEFIENYDKLFNHDFMNALSKQSYKDLYLDNGVSNISFGVGKSTGDYEGSVILKYIQVDSIYKLRFIQGAGGNFYSE
ncbi:MAG TPA: hypothetical protein VNW99_10405 [Cytophagaceae bacterium]|jgi:hypothetical protein|nr:hypothetical protein [Cytophagaceae bacterium]